MNTIYPAYSFRASPTYFAWVKLTCADIHALRSEPGFEGMLQNSINPPIWCHLSFMRSFVYVH